MMDSGQWANLARMLLKPLFFSEGHPGLFGVHREPGLWINVFSK